VPPPRRGELVRLFGDVLREQKEPLGRLVSLDAGKILPEGLGEVQEMIDICDFAVGLSRQLYGLTIATERPNHRMMETWHPLGVVGVISAFNFPVAVWAWNACLALVCGDSVVWKPSEKTPLTAHAVVALFARARSGSAMRRRGWSSWCRAGARPARLWSTIPGWLGLRDRIHQHGPAGGAAGGGALRPVAAGAWRQQRHDRGAVGRS
jgi:hypothetical protein